MKGGGVALIVLPSIRDECGHLYCKCVIVCVCVCMCVCVCVLTIMSPGSGGPSVGGACVREEKDDGSHLVSH